jgi:hypothetical protein
MARKEMAGKTCVEPFGTEIAKLSAKTPRHLS